jgi:hypothetical protein
MKLGKLIITIIIILLFLSCGTVNTKNENRTSNDIVFYRLSKGEELSKFIETQNRMNEYARFEHTPTGDGGKEMFDYFVEHFEEYFNRNDESRQNLQNENLLDFFRLHYLYSIIYDNTNKLWTILFIGRSTELVLQYTSNRTYANNNNFRFSNNLIPRINNWMELNNISSLDFSIRVNFSLNNEIFTLEMLGEPVNFNW